MGSISCLFHSFPSPGDIGCFTKRLENISVATLYSMTLVDHLGSTDIQRAANVKGFLDQIDAQWKPRETWIQGGLEAFRLALMARDRHQLRFTVGLGFSLKSGEKTF
jgi:hypothetical protein